MLNNINIMRMTSEHINDVMIVEHLSFKIPWSKNAFAEEVTKNKFARYFVAGVNGKIIGYAGMWKIFDEGHITNIAVHPEFRGAGVGSLLLEALLSAADDEGILSITLEVRKSNIIAQSLYGKYGFVTEGIRKGYYSDTGEDAVIMWKR